MKKTYLLFFLFVAGTTFLLAQDKDTKKADQHYDRLEYIKAAEGYEKLIGKGKSDPYVYMRAGHSYYFINKTDKAEPYYKQAVEGGAMDPETVYNYAQTLKANGKTSESNKWMQTFAEQSPSDSRAIAFKRDPDYIPRIMDQVARFTASLVGELQSGFTDFGGERVGDKLYFTSSRNTSGKKYGMNAEPFLDIYEATYSNGTYTDIKEVSGDVNTKFHEGVVAVTADGSRMYFDRNDYYKGKYSKDEEGINQLNIYYAELVDGRWRDVKPVPFNNSGYSVGHPALSPDGGTLYFVSDMPGSIGDSDIYKVSIDSEGNFGTPENLGKGINTEGKEVFPFVGQDGTLYFSSDGHLGLGGLDVFSAGAVPGGFSGVENLGKPVNSPADDFAFKFDNAVKEGFVSSNRSGGNDNIYLIKEIEVCSSTLRSIVLNEYTREPISGAAVSLYDTNENLLSSNTSGGDGRHDFEVECGYGFVVQASKEGFEPGAARVTSREGEVAAEVLLRPIEDIIVEDKVVLNPILFDFDKHDIKPQAAMELDRLVGLMKKYPNMVIKVEGHTDSRGSAEYNKQLSDRRAKSTVAYVISKGIDAARISGEGFGQERPEVDCGANCTEADHDKNRRSDFIIVER